MEALTLSLTSTLKRVSPAPYLGRKTELTLVVQVADVPPLGASEREKELSQCIVCSSTQETGPCNSPGEHNGSAGMGMGELAPEY